MYSGNIQWLTLNKYTRLVVFIFCEVKTVCVSILFLLKSLPLSDACFRDGVEQSTQPSGAQTRDNESSSTCMVPRKEGL